DIARSAPPRQSQGLCGGPSRRRPLIAPEPVSIIPHPSARIRSTSMRFWLPVITLGMLAAAATTPLRAQSGEEIILADPAFSMTFAAGYVATDLGLWAKHGLKVKTVSISGIGA